MADPLRRTLLAKLRGKKSKKGATVGGGFGSAAAATAAAAAAANGGREGKEKVLRRRDSDEARPVILLECTAERMSTYENCVDGAVVQAGGVLLLRESRAAELAAAAAQERGSGGGGGRARVHEQLLGVSLQREFGAERGARPGLLVPAKRLATVPWQCSVGDSIGFGDNSNHVLSRVEPPPRSRHGAPADPRHMAGTVLAVNVHSWTLDNQQTLVNPGSAEENLLIRSVEGYPGYEGDLRAAPGALQSPTFFPTELEICDIDMCAADPLDSEDEDYYDNEILPLYATITAKSDRAEVAAHGAQDEGRDSGSAQETDRLRNRLKEAYYLLINAMNDINMDVQQISGGLTEQQAASSCSSHSRDSLCSRLSAKNMDSDSWSSGGEHSPQQVSDTDSLLLCLGANREPGLNVRLKSKSVTSLSPDKARPVLRRSASDGAIRYTGGPPPLCAKVPGSLQVRQEVTEERGAPGEASDPQAPLHDATSTEELLQEEPGGGRLHESSGSVNSLTGSSDSNADQHRGAERAGVRAPGGGSPNKAHGVTVNKMQEWMHKGRLLSTEMKQRIEGSSSPRRGHTQNQNQNQERPQTSSCRGAKSVKAKSPTGKLQQQHPAFIENVQSREAARSGELSAAWRPPHVNTITVSKKRNWLQQSSLARSQGARDEAQQGAPGAEEDAGGQCSQQPPPPPSPSPEHLRPSGGAPSRPARLHLPQVSIGQAKISPHPRSVDPAEENDADDEGEIWYNPIPEDDEPAVVSHARPSVRLLVPARAEPQRRPSRGGDASEPGGASGSGGEGPPEALGEILCSGDGSSGNAAHSTEALHLHRQMLACKPQEEGGPSTGRSTDVPDLPNIVGFSPPSSPNPAKKSSSINWSFPDKIKSPRTVRKISMKMKKLPELSRKLSVKGASSSSSNNNNGGGGGGGGAQSEPRAQSARREEAGSSDASGRRRLAAPGGAQASRNVISRYHLDSSVSTQHSFGKKKNGGGGAGGGSGSKSASKGGYLSDGDSPELVAKSGKHGPPHAKPGKGREAEGSAPKPGGADLDIDAFRHYSFTEQPKCGQYISGLMSLHFYGAEDLKPPRVDSRDVYCAIQVDSVNKARTALLTCRTAFLDMDHTFNIELENAQHLKLVVFSWEPTPRRNRVCCHGTVALPPLFRVTRSHQLAVKLEPRGLIYVKLGLMERWQNSLDGGPDGEREPQVFGVEAWRVVEREDAGLAVPLLISKCINEIEKRGCQVVGLYRLCGSAAVKKELREAFERDSYGVELCENTYPDINVITGVLKDYLRELPYPLITKQLYEAVLEAMAARPLRMGSAGCENEAADTEHTLGLLELLPEVERTTLRTLLDHLKRVASHQEVNKMTCQNLAVCFGPVLLSQRQDASCHSNRVFIDSEELASALHFKKHIEVLHYLLQLWPVVDANGQSSSQSAASPAPAPPPSSGSPDLLSAPPPLRRRKERPQVLNLTEAEMAGVLRPKPGRLDSPSNRYAGDWSGCGDSYFPSDLPPSPPPGKEEADYDDVPSEDGGEEEEDREEEAREDKHPAQEEEEEGEKPAEREGSDNKQQQQQQEDDDEEEEEGEEEEEEEEEEESLCEHILPPPPLPLPKEHTYQAYMKIQDISPVLSNRVNLRDLQESIDTLIGNLERELNKNKLNVGY